MKRKLLILFLAVVSAVCIALGLSACYKGNTEFTEGGLKFERSRWNYGYAVTGVESYDLTSVEIPESTNGKPIVSIDKRAFFGCYKLTDITLPDSITFIDEWAFGGCASLTSFTIPDSVKNIGDWAFYGCTSLETLKTPIINFNYLPSNLKTLEFTSGDYIEIDTLSNCRSITDIIIPASVVRISTGAFVNCGGITSITVAEKNAVYRSGGNCIIEKSSNAVVAGCKASVIPDSVTSIAYGAFKDCTWLKAITIPENVSDIEQYAFEGCASLTDVTICNGVDSIGRNAFENCNELINVTIGDSAIFIDKSAFENTALYNDENNWQDCVLYIGKHLIKAKDTILGNVEIKEGTITIADYAFEYCSELTGITIPDSVTYVGSNAFSSCYGIKTAKMPTLAIHAMNKFNLETVKLTSGDTIGDNAFRYCEKLKSIVLPDGITSIGDSAFTYCRELISINLPDSVTYIGSSAFQGCSMFESINIPAGVTFIGNWAFAYCNELSEFIFGGTTEEWCSINKDFWWDDYTGDYIVHCTDGDLTKTENDS